MFVVRRHFPLWLYDSLKPLHCLSPYPLCPGMRFTPSISEKITSSLVNFSKDASVPLFPCFSGCLFAGANAFGGNEGTWSRPLAVSPGGGVACRSFRCGSPAVPAWICAGTRAHGAACLFVFPRAMRARPGLRMKISARFEWVPSFSYANRVH